MGHVVEWVMDYVSSNPGCTFSDMMSYCPYGSQSSLGKALQRMSKGKYLRREVVKDARREGMHRGRPVYAYWVV